MFSKFLIAAVAVVAIASTCALAAMSVTLTVCTDHECKTGCKAIQKRPVGTCVADHFGHQGSMKSMCGPAPAANCFYFGLFTSNATANQCVDANADMVDYLQCGQCTEEKFMKGRFLTTTCNADGTVAHSLGCDATCTTCKHKMAPLKEGA